jgi:predicted RNA binding protein YcfA (HicA-like mRNA interferase family)
MRSTSFASFRNSSSSASPASLIVVGMTATWLLSWRRAMSFAIASCRRVASSSVAHAQERDARASVNRLDILASDPTLYEGLTGKDLLRLLRKAGCTELRQKGSHVVVQCGTCQTVVPVHAGEDLGPGLLRAVERDLEPCLGKGWLRQHRS